MGKDEYIVMPKKVIAENNTSAAKPTKKKKLLPILIAVILLAAIAAFFLLRNDKGRPEGDAQTTAAYTEVKVEKRSITSTITGSGALEAANNYSVTTLAQGTILTDTFEEGDIVEKDTVLYTIDASDVSTSLEQAEISFRQTQRSYERKMESLENLNVKAEKAGRIISLDVEVGDEVKAGQTLATVQQIDIMELEVPFPADDAANFTVGQSAAVTLDSTFETLPGTILEVSPLTKVLAGNRIVRNVKISVANPGGLSELQTASAAVDGINSTAAGSFVYEEAANVISELTGEVVSIKFALGDAVKKGDILVVLESETLRDEIEAAEDSLRNAQISLDNRYDQLDNYTIKSPISGTIIDKNYKAGETSEANQVMCTIYDLSYLTMTLDVDELDISNIKQGQVVTITADAVDGKTYEGIVTKVSVAGTYSSGVTTYPVTIRLDETEGLLPGMNVDATIVLESASDVIAVPTGALQRGNRVMVTADSPSAAKGEPTEIKDANGNAYVSLRIETGVADEEYVQVLSGLQEGDTIAYMRSSRSGGNRTGGNRTGGMSMPMGGMGGTRMPSGGNNRYGGNR